VKAAFLFHFAQYVEWPDGALKDASSPLVYCTIGEDPFRGALDATLKGKTIGGHSVEVRHLQKVSPGCHLVFIGEAEKKQIPATLGMLKGSPALTVGESPGFAQQGGMIGLFLEENKIRFEINLETTTQANLKISARLLALAKRVIGGPRGN
jgi:hypothetical protein